MSVVRVVLINAFCKLTFQRSLPNICRNELYVPPREIVPYQNAHSKYSDQTVQPQADQKFSCSCQHF